MNWRKIPHPTYGNFGGREKRAGSGKKPIDWMDAVFEKHDLELKAAKNEVEVDEADCMLVERLLEGNPKELLFPIYGRIYRWGALIIFRIKCSRL